MWIGRGESELPHVHVVRVGSHVEVLEVERSTQDLPVRCRASLVQAGKDSPTSIRSGSRALQERRSGLSDAAMEPVRGFSSASASLKPGSKEPPGPRHLFRDRRRRCLCVTLPKNTSGRCPVVLSECADRHTVRRSGRPLTGLRRRQSSFCPHLETSPLSASRGLS